MIDGKLSTIRCKHLVILPSKKTLCRIWNKPDRIGTDIGHGNRCTLRENHHVNYLGCEYNRDDWQMVDIKGDWTRFNTKP